jgi:hypothetical protein
MWINKLKVHRAWKKVVVGTHPLSLTCISRYTGHYRDREMGAIQAKGPDWSAGACRYAGRDTRSALIVVSVSLFTLV